MNVRTLYLDSSVIGGYFDTEWQDATRELWRQWKGGKWRYMKTKLKTFDAVAASRKWREETGRMLDAMPAAERLAFLEGLRTSGGGRPEVKGIREEESDYQARSETEGEG